MNTNTHLGYCNSRLKFHTILNLTILKCVIQNRDQSIKFCLPHVNISFGVLAKTELIKYMLYVSVNSAYVFLEIMPQSRFVRTIRTLMGLFSCVDHHMEPKILFAVATFKGFVTDGTGQSQRCLQ